MRELKQHSLHWLSLLVLVLLFCCSVTQPVSADQRHLRRLFDSLDKDHDGELRRQELKEYIGELGAPEYSHSTKLDQAVEKAIGRLDSPDVGLGVSWTELEQHLHTLLQDVKVADWVTHGLGLPQYAEAFRSNSITALDLPMLVNDGGKLLQTELKVESPLHRQRLLRAMQRQILGLGAAPGPLQHLRCSVTQQPQHTPTVTAAARTHADGPASTHANAAAGVAGAGAPAQAGTAAAAAAAGAAAVVCSWLPPADPGQPGMHKYVLQRVDHSAQSAVWQTVAELHDSLSVRHRDVPPRPGMYQYRLAAWNVYGRSPYILSFDVMVPDQQAAAAAAGAGTAAAAAAAGVGIASAAAAVPAGSGTGHPVAYRTPQQLVPSVAGAGVQQQRQQQEAGSCSGASLCHPDGLVVPYHEQWLVQQQQHSAAHTASCSSGSLHNACDPSNESQQGCTHDFGQQLSTVAGWGPTQQSPSGGVVWLLNPGQQWPQTNAATAAGRAAQQGLAASVQAAAAAGDSAAGDSAAGNAHRYSGSGAAGGAAIGSDSSQEPATTARLVALLGSAWHSSMSSWLKALLNSLTAFLLVVLPICVRLLPVHMLTQAAQVLAWGLHFLPAPLRQRLLLRQAAAVDQQQVVGGQLGLLQEGEGQLGSGSGSVGSRSGTPQRATALEAAAYQQLGPLDSSIAAGTANGQTAAAGLAAARSPVATLPPAAVAVAGSPTAGAAAGVRRRIMPRSVSDFDLVRQGRSKSPAARTRTTAEAAFSCSPVRRGYMAGGLAGAAGLRFASSGGAAGAAAVGAGDVWSRSLAADADAAQADAAAAAATAVGSVDEEVERELQYMLCGGGQGSMLPDNKRCCFPGCQQQFGLRHWKATMQRHYCGRCQQAFCMQHTAYSPHGTSGTCGVQSRCLCIDCFYEYTPEYQAFLASRNTLVGKRSRSGPPGAAAAVSVTAGTAAGAVGGSSAESSSAGGGKGTGLLSRLVPQSLSGSQKQLAASSSSSSPGSSGDGTMLAPKGAASQQQQQQEGRMAAAAVAGSAQTADVLQQVTAAEQQSSVQQPPARQRALGMGASAPTAACSKGMKSRMLWGRGLTKALGVVRFKHGGDMHVGAGSQRQHAAAAVGATTGEAVGMSTAAAPS